MKRSAVLTLCAPVLLFALTAGLSAQTQPAAGAQPPASTPATSANPPETAGPATRPQRMTPDQMANGLARRLSLTDDQKAKILPILADRQQKIQDLQADNSGRPMQRMRKMKSIQDDTDRKLNAIFTPDQQKAYAKIEEERKEQMKEKRQERQSGQ